MYSNAFRHLVSSISIVHRLTSDRLSPPLTYFLRMPHIVVIAAYSLASDHLHPQHTPTSSIHYSTYKLAYTNKEERDSFLANVFEEVDFAATSAADAFPHVLLAFASKKSLSGGGALRCTVGMGRSVSVRAKVLVD